MTNTTLFATLLRSIYALDGVAGEFLADLTRPIPYAQHGADVREGVLAGIPATIHANLVDVIVWHETAIREEITFACEDRDDESDETIVDILTDLDSVSPTVVYVRELREGLRELRVDLATL